MAWVSELMRNPKSKILERGYINVYSELTPQEERGLFYKREYKKIHPDWNDTTIILCQLFAKVLKKLNLQNEKRELVVLDVGCGHGNYVIDEFRSKITWACGVDLYEKFTRKNICLDEIRYTDLNRGRISYESGTFDIVFAFWLLEHLENPAQAFQESYRVLKPGGFFIFATPNKSCLLISLKRLVRSATLTSSLNKILYGRKSDVFPTLYRANDLRTLRRMLMETGFEDISLKLNYDPSYTSFNGPTFEISNALDYLFEKLAPHFYKQHIIGMARRPV